LSVSFGAYNACFPAGSRAGSAQNVGFLEKNVLVRIEAQKRWA